VATVAGIIQADLIKIPGLLPVGRAAVATAGHLAVRVYLDKDMLEGTALTMPGPTPVGVAVVRALLGATFPAQMWVATVA
jgi:hypothetical protein